MKALRRARGTVQKQAPPCASRAKLQIVAHDPPAGVCIARLLQTPHRDRAMLLVAYDTALRAGELVAIEVEHVEGPVRDGSGLLFIPKSKTDQKGEGRHAYLARKTMEAIAAWRQATKVNTGPLFRSIRFHPDGSPRKLQRKAVRADSVPAITGHSTRVGVAQDNFAAGEDLSAIMQAYGWKDTRTVLRYGRKLAVRSGAASRLAAKVWDEA